MPVKTTLAAAYVENTGLIRHIAQIMKGRKQELKNGSEHDLLYGRNIYCYLDRAGVTKSIKRGMNKRARREAKQIALAELYETHQ